MTRQGGATRRVLLKAAMFVPAIAIAERSPLFGAMPARNQEAGETEVSTVEDLMREHGVLRRVLLVYQEAVRRIEQKSDVPLAAVASAAKLVRRFVEEYHEKLEEDYLFPRFRKAATLVDLVDVLQEQHKRGRTLTAAIEKLATSPASNDTGQRASLRRQLQLFVAMYEPHAAREDTVLFPAFKKIVSPKEYDALGDEFEKKEQQLFGKDGFEKSVEEVTALEKQLGIYDLGRFTPPDD